MSHKTILFVSAGLEAIPAIQRAKQLGLTVVVSDRDATAPGVKHAEHFLQADTYNIEETLIAAKQFHAKIKKINGVICVAADVPKTVAVVAKELGLPSISIYSAVLASDKLAMKRQFFSDEIPIPWFSAIRSLSHLESIIEQEKCKLVLKPVDSRGARGVLQLQSGIDLVAAYNESLKFSPTGRVMVERFLDGPQVSTESLVIDGVVSTPGFSDRNYEFLDKYAPYIIENGGDLPSFLDKKTHNAIRGLLQKAALSMEIDTGVIKGDIVIHQGIPHIIELAARLSGGYFCTHEIPLNTGVDFVGCAIRQAIGEEIEASELLPKFQKYVSQRYIFPEAGKVISIKGQEIVEQRAEVAFLDVRLKKGDTVLPAHNHPARAGMVIATGETRSQAQENAQRAIDDIFVEIENDSDSSAPILPY